jgi:NAD(P)H dehydrogenase (quinone)
MTATARVHIIYYTTYLHIKKLADAVAAGARRVPGVEVKLFQVAETLPEDILKLIHAAPKPNDPIATPDDLKAADGFLLGFPTRFGTVPAQIKAFLDSTGALWGSGALRGKQAGTFFSTSTQHGGQETTALTILPYFAHHGVQYVPFGFGHPALQSTKEVLGGGPYGAGVIALNEGESPSKLELEIAEAQGEYFAKQVLIRVLGEKALAEKK